MHLIYQIKYIPLQNNFPWKEKYSQRKTFSLDIKKMITIYKNLNLDMF